MAGFVKNVWQMGVLVGLAIGFAGCGAMSSDGSREYKDTFVVDKGNWESEGISAYYMLVPGHVMRYGHKADSLTIKVTWEVKVVDGVETRVVEEREEVGGKLAEISRNYFAMDKATGDLYYFGEDVDIYKDGKVTGHEGSWLSGEQGAKYGLMVPGRPKEGQKFQMEVAPGVAMDRGEVASVSEEVKTPAGVFMGCVKILETSAMEKGTALKVFAPGVGLVKDDEFELAEMPG